MKCPFCSFADSKVVDSRPDKEGPPFADGANVSRAGKDLLHMSGSRKYYL